MNFVTENGLKVRLSPDFFFRYLSERQFQTLRLDLEIAHYAIKITNIIVSFWLMLSNAKNVFSFQSMLLIYLCTVCLGLYARFYVLPFLIRFIYGFFYTVLNIFGGSIGSILVIVLQIAVIITALSTGNIAIVGLFLGAGALVFIAEHSINIFGWKKIHNKFDIALTSTEVLSFRLLKYYEEVRNESHKSIEATVYDYAGWCKEDPIQ